MGGTSYLASLNPEQRRAVVHGVATTGANVAGPLLVIAGAGSGKTSTLAHRVAHLIVHGADPGRMLLLTFSRRAAADMERRAQRIIANAVGEARSGGRSPITWSGTFHAVGARLLRMYAGSVGLDPSFTIHDREDSADLLNLVRHEQGLSEKATEISAEVHVSRHLLARRQRRRSPRCRPCQAIPMVRRVGKRSAQPVRRVCRGQARVRHVLDYDDLLLYWGELMQVPELARDVGALVDHVLVDE